MSFFVRNVNLFTANAPRRDTYPILLLAPNPCVSATDGSAEPPRDFCTEREAILLAMRLALLKNF
jgi:hypothetical protein